MKVKLYRVDKYSADMYENAPNLDKTLIATFEGQGEAERFAYLANSTEDLHSYILDLGRGKFSRVYQSRRVTLCPTCGSEYRKYEVSHRDALGTIRCDGCETLFEWDTKFDGSRGAVKDKPRTD